MVEQEQVQVIYHTWDMTCEKKFTPFVTFTYTSFGTIDNKKNNAHNQEHPRTPPFDPSHRKYTGRITVLP